MQNLDEIQPYVAIEPFDYPAYFKNYSIEEKLKTLSLLMKELNENSFNGEIMSDTYNSFIRIGAETINFVKNYMKTSKIIKYVNLDYKEVKEIDCKGVTNVLLLSDNRIATTSFNDNIIRIWILNGVQIQNVLKGHFKAIVSIDKIPKKEEIVSFSLDKRIIIWNYQSGNMLKIINTNFNSIVVISELEFIGAADSKISIIDTHSCERNKPFIISQTSINSNPIGYIVKLEDHLIACAGLDKIITIFNYKTLSISFVLKGHKAEVLDVVKMSESSKIIASSSKDNSILTWDYITGNLLKSINTGTILLKLLRIDSSTLLSTGDQTIIWDIKTGVRIRKLPLLKNTCSTAVIKDNEIIAIGQKDSILKIFHK